MAETHSDSTGTGLVLGVLVVTLAIIAVMLFGRNLIGGTSTTETGTQVEVPRQVDVNVNSGQGQ